MTALWIRSDGVRRADDQGRWIAGQRAVATTQSESFCMPECRWLERGSSMLIDIWQRCRLVVGHVNCRDDHGRRILKLPARLVYR